MLVRGVTTARWLYGDDPRSYSDVDFLVDPTVCPDCERVLETIGFQRSAIERAFLRERPRHASTWVRGSVTVDLHRTLVGVGVSAEEAWAVLSGTTEIWKVGGAEVEVLNAGARSLVLALHMAQHGPRFGRTKDDLEHAMARVPESTWFEAAHLARQLRAETSMAAGLQAVAGGSELCETLSLPLGGVTAVDGSTSFHTAQGLLWLIQTKGVRAKAQYLWLKLFPPPFVMRGRIAWSRAGRPALVLAYGLRLARITLHAPGAVWALVRLGRRPPEP